MNVWQPGVTLDEMEMCVIIQALKFYHGNRTHTAESLNIALRTLTNKITKYKEMGIDVPPAPSTPPAHHPHAHK